MDNIFLFFMNLLHILIGLIIVFFILWFFIRVHIYFSKDNKPISPIVNKT